eukprot:9446695-Prorocentrum_lima.AAC.1
MTSSLVGSEMCIRDRSMTTWLSGSMGIGAGSSHPTCLCSASAMGVFAPVSYTHLTLPTICSV